MKSTELQLDSILGTYQKSFKGKIFTPLESKPDLLSSYRISDAS